MAQVSADSGIAQKRLVSHRIRLFFGKLRCYRPDPGWQPATVSRVGAYGSWFNPSTILTILKGRGPSYIWQNP